MLYRLTFLDELLADPSSGTCHHNAIPLAKKHYLTRYKVKLGNVNLNLAKTD